MEFILECTLDRGITMTLAADPGMFLDEIMFVFLSKGKVFFSTKTKILTVYY